MRFTDKIYLVAFALSVFTFSLWAAHTDSIPFETTQPTTIGATQLNPGSYELRAEEGQSELQVIRDGKVIATVPCQWTQLTSKAADSEVQTSNNQVTGVQFAGRTDAIQFNR
jgi:hypothetical protein